VQYQTKQTKPVMDVVARTAPAYRRPQPVGRTQSPSPSSSVSEAEQRIIAAITSPALADKLTKAQKMRKVTKISAWAVVGAVVIGGLSLFSQEIGEIALAIYAVVALWRRWPSQQTFALALAMFGGIILSSLLTSFNLPYLDNIQQISENLAVYAFLLLCIGTVALAREVRHDSHQTASD
jgi:hypothetical protein